MSTALLDFDTVIELPFGGIGVRIAEGEVSEMVYLPASIAPVKPRNALAREVARQVKAYVKRPSHRFDLPLAARGSEFQRKVWDVIASIPAGQTLSYGDVARRIRILNVGKRVVTAHSFEVVAAATMARKRLRISHFSLYLARTD